MTNSPTPASGFDRSQIEDIKQRIKIEEVIGRYVKLKAVGKNLFGLCPFHKEDSPSFSVNPELNIFKCYGCGEAGDVFSFLEKVENFTFFEVLTQLARETGVELKVTKASPEQTQKTIRARKATELTATFYNFILQKHKLGQPGRDYIKERAISDESIEAYKIGYAPKSISRRQLISFFLKKGFTAAELVEFGLAGQRGSQYYDKFTDRLMFSIFDNSGNIIGFSGRVISQADDRPKYLNSPETVIFQKRNNLFGLYHAKKAIREDGFVILVEGQIDVISSRQVGVANIVAPLGTGISAEQISRLKRFTNNIALAFDNDTAGFSASKRVAALAYSLGLNVSAIEVSSGKDVDECIQKNPDLWTKAVAEKRPCLSHFLNVLLKENDPKSLEGRQRITSELIPILAAVTDKLSRSFHVEELATALNVEPSIIYGYLSTATAKILPQSNNLKQSHPQPAKLAQISKEAHLLTILMQYADKTQWVYDKITPDDFQNEVTSDLYASFIKYMADRETFVTNDFLKSVGGPTAELATELVMRPVWAEEPQSRDLRNEILLTISLIKLENIRAEINDLKKQLANAERDKDVKLTNSLMNEISQKITELKALE